MSAVRRERGAGFRWEGVRLLPYARQAGGTGPRAPAPDEPTRQELFGADHGLPFELRYFELPPGGRTSLERHRHAHAVVVLRGRGRVLVGHEVAPVGPHDLVHVPPGAWHQLRADDDAPLGFLCAVSHERDRGVPPTREQLDDLRRDPAVAAFLDA